MFCMLKEGESENYFFPEIAHSNKVNNTLKTFIHHCMMYDRNPKYGTISVIVKRYKMSFFNQAVMKSFWMFEV